MGLLQKRAEAGGALLLFLMMWKSTSSETLLGLSEQERSAPTQLEARSDIATLTSLEILFFRFDKEKNLALFGRTGVTDASFRED